MATAAEIEAQIKACEATIARELVDKEEAQREREQAVERQRLRRILERKQKILKSERDNKEALWGRRAAIDLDIAGPHAVDIGVSLDEDGLARLNGHARQRPEGPFSSQRHTMDCLAAILKGELEWSIKGMTWLRDALEYDTTAFAASSGLVVGNHEFQLCYHPAKGKVGLHDQKASLAIQHMRVSGDLELLSFRYKLSVMSRQKGYVQWGEDGQVCVEEDLHGGFEGYVFGPDVCASDSDDVPNGIFGLTHQQLIESEWVIDDVLTVKLQISVREDLPAEEKAQSVEAVIKVPPSTLTSDWLELLDSGSKADVTFDVQGETIQAHSLVLCARSEVLQRQFACGMQETSSKRVVIEDCEPRAFKAFLRYLYSDDFPLVEKFLKEGGNDLSLRSAESTVQQPFMPAVQQLLALAHKYQLSRLQLWCESMLVGNISIEHVCSLLCQAHLYMAKNLEKMCLDFIKQNLNQVFGTEAYTSLHQKWPQLSLKITAHLGNVPEATVAEAMGVQQKTGKRKRED